MAVDKTEPPIKVILTVAGLSLGILVTMRVFFVSYYNNAYETRSHQQVDAMLQAEGGSYLWTAARVRAEEARRLTGLPAAIAAVSRGQRPGAISPAPSVDVAPLAGWTLAPREVPRPAPVVAPAAPPSIGDIPANGGPMQFPAPNPPLGAAGQGAGGPVGTVPPPPSVPAAAPEQPAHPTLAPSPGAH
jgi:hypothetical protein